MKMKLKAEQLDGFLAENASGMQSVLETLQNAAFVGESGLGKTHLI
jgi:DNA replication protein DnaC